MNINDISIEKLKNNQLLADFSNVFAILEKVQNLLLSLKDKSDEKPLTLLKAGSILVMALVSKVFNEKKSPKDFSKSDWKNIADQVAQFAIIPTDDEYDVFVFSMYSNYIRQSVSLLNKRTSKNISEKKVAVESDSDCKTEKICEKITAIADDIDGETELFRKGEISEVAYIEGCLWLSLEAMIKLLSGYLGALGGEEYSELAVAAASFCFEFGRLLMYKRENAILTEYLESQGKLDEELECKFKNYINDLNEQNRRFKELMDNAFSSDFRARLRNTAELAISLGVPKNEVLKSVDDVDDFFMN